ncbi:response regulator [Sulfitobacter alexandrii]|uniref:Response regulator n=1 Tax=Sulfitobacter alexandrii TaxID=1917485 RepID=A0A1J0WK05_9RHOB|nr:response regulator [Sulfitobacter alexandrii]APE44635.1 response regulator [Sulfitobacter alexandrii]
MRILAVDDDPVILDLLERALSDSRGYQLTTCKTAEEALALLAGPIQPFECFLLDVMLPGIDGIELCDRIRQTQAYRSAPIIMITASREADLMERAFYAGATDFISKPLDGVELSARIVSASMLNDSLHREREVRHTLADLTAKMKVRFEEPIKLETPQVTDLLALENSLLRLPEGLYAMTLFTVDVMGLRGIHRAVAAPAFRHHLESVASALVQALEHRTSRLAYTGSGRFMGVVIGRERFSRDAVLTQMNATLSADWDVAASGTPMPPAIRLTSLSDQRLWSGVSASDMLRSKKANADLLRGVPEEQEDALFDKLDAKVSRAS